MPLGPMNKFDTAPVAHFQFKQGNRAYSLAGLTAKNFVLHMYLRPSKLHKTGGGTFSIIDSGNGYVDYQWNGEDTDIPGLWDVWTEVITAQGPMSSTNVETMEITDRWKGIPTKNWKGRTWIIEPPLSVMP